MNARSLIGNTFVAFLSQGLALGMSVLSSLLIPKVMGVQEFGYWQLFLFYASYVGFFHLGLNDGVYLINGGTPRDAIDKRGIISQYWLGLAFQAVFAVALIAAALLGPFGEQRGFVICATAVYILLQNSALYLGYVFQAMNETRLFSYSIIVERFAFLVPLVWLLATGVDDCRPYVVAYNFSSVCQLAFCMWHARDFLAAGLEGLPTVTREALASVRVGIKLMFANLASQLILGAARALIDAAWGIEVFGKLSFAISMVTAFLMFVQQVSMVLFPELRQSDAGQVQRFFAAVRDVMSLAFPAVYLLYYPAVWLLGLWLPDYAESLVFFAFLLPVCVFDSKMDVCGTTFFKVRREEGRLLAINLVCITVSTAVSYVGAYLVGNVFVVIGGVVATLVARSVYSERLIARELDLADGWIWAGEIVITALFIGSVVTLPMAASLIVYAVGYAIFLWAFRRRVASLMTWFRRRGA